MHDSFVFILCGAVMPVFLVATGIRFGIRLRLFYILHPIKTAKAMLGGKGGFKALSLALAGTLGIGNIVGVASALQWGGSGALFWMVLSSVVAMSIKYAETFLSVKCRRFDGKAYTGGAPFYILEAVHGKKARVLALIFAVMSILNSLITGNMVQINGVTGVLPVSPIVLGIGFSFAFFIIILEGVDRLSSFTSVIIPSLTFLHIFISLFIILRNFGDISSVSRNIIKDAFNIKGAIYGVSTYSILTAVRYGVSRGVLSNEAGCGTSPIAHAETKNSPHVQGCLGILEVLVDTAILCTITGTVILLYGIDTDISPIELVCAAYGFFAGKLGKIFIKVSCLIYALSTLLSQFYYGDKSLNYITKRNKPHRIYLFIFVSVSIISPILPINTVWKISDLNIVFLTVFNLVILNLSLKSFEKSDF